MRTKILMTGALAAMMASAALGWDVSVNARGEVRTCADVEFRMGGGAAVVSEERLTVGGRLLAIRLGDGHGLPLRVTGSDRSDYEILLCKAAEDEAALGGLRLEQRGAEIGVVGPAAGGWHGYLLVKAPRDAELEITASNGPVSISDLAGVLRATVANGPLSLKGVGGTVEVEASNGPVSFRGGSGDVSIAAKNGPVSIRLDGGSWEGGELRASAKNGPVTLSVPKGFASGVIVERGARAPFKCPVEMCGERPEFFRDDQTRIEIGRGMPRIHVAAKNGPISIRELE